MKFTYNITGIGWAKSEFEINGKSVICTPGYLSDSLGNLVNQIIHLTPELVNDDEIREDIQFEWDMEPAGHQWNIYKIGNEDIRIRITKYDDLSSYKNPELILDEICKLYDFLCLIHDILDKLIKKHGLVGYKDSWIDYEFPVSAYIKLKNYILNRRRFNVDLIDEQGLIEYYYSDINKEVNLIKGN